MYLLFKNFKKKLTIKLIQLIISSKYKKNTHHITEFKY